MCYRPHLKVFQHVLNHVAPRFPLGNLLFSSCRDEHRNAETVVGTIQFWGNMTNQPIRISKKIKKNLGGFSQASAKFTVQFRLRQKTGNAERNPMGGLCFSNDPHKVNLRTLHKVFRHSGGIDGCYSDLPSGNQLWLKLENPKKT